MFLRKVGFGSLLVQIHHPALLLLVRVSSPQLKEGASGDVSALRGRNPTSFPVNLAPLLFFLDSFVGSSSCPS